MGFTCVRERTLKRGALVFYEGEEEGRGIRLRHEETGSEQQQDARFEDWLSPVPVPVPRAGLRLPAALRGAEWSPCARTHVVLQFTFPSVGIHVDVFDILSRMTLTTAIDCYRPTDQRSFEQNLKHKSLGDLEQEANPM